MTEPALLFLLALAGRAFDMWTTYLVTPDLEGEANALVRRLGWKLWGGFNVVVAYACSRFGDGATVVVFALSLAAGFWNLWVLSRRK